MTNEVIAVNPTTGERVAYRNGAWVPIASEQPQPQRPAPQAQRPQPRPQQGRPQGQPAQPRDNRPRGIRNNNPGNIEDGAFARSLPGYKGSDGRFAIFETPEAGDHAKTRLLGSYIERGFNTPSKIINRWAPPSDNNPTSNYAAYVARRVGVGPNDVVTAEHIPAIAAAIAEFENGGQVKRIGAPAAAGDVEVVNEFPPQEASPTEAVNPDTGERARLIDGEWVTVDDNGFLLAAEDDRWGTRENPWTVDSVGGGDAKAGDWLRTDNGLQQIRAVTPNEARGEQVAGTNVFLNESGIGQNVGATVLAASEQLPFSNDLLAASRAAMTGQSSSDARQDIRDLKEVDRATDQEFRNVGGLLGFGATLAIPTAGAGFVAQGANRADKARRLGLLGAAGSGFYGVGTSDGDAGERAQAGAISAAVGAPLAFAAPYVAPVTKWVGTRAGSGISEVGNSLRTAIGLPPGDAVIRNRNTEAAGRYVQGLLSRAGADPLADPRLAMDRPLTLAEAIGPTGVSHLTALNRRAGRTGSEASKTLGARADDTGARIVSDFEEIAGVAPSTARETVESIARAGRERAAPLYEEAYAMPAQMTENLSAILNTPSGRQALNQAARIAGDEMRDPAALGFVTDAAGNVAEVAAPTIQTLDYIKRGLDAVLDGSRNPITGKLQLDTKTRPIVGLTEKLRAEIIEQTGGEAGPYARALAEAGDAIRIEQAIEQAPRLFSQRVTDRDFEAAISRMGDAERQALVAGFGEKLLDDAKAGKLTVAALNKLDVDLTRNKLSQLIGDDAAADLFDRIRAEVDMGRTGQRMMPNTNSTTGEVMAANAEMDRGSNVVENVLRNISKHGALEGSLTSVADGVVAIPRAFLRGAATPATQATRDEIGRLLLMPPREAMEELNRISGRGPIRASGGLLSPPDPPRAPMSPVGRGLLTR